MDILDYASGGITTLTNAAGNYAGNYSSSITGKIKEALGSVARSKPEAIALAYQKNPNSPKREAVKLYEKIYQAGDNAGMWMVAIGFDGNLSTNLYDSLKKEPNKEIKLSNGKVTTYNKLMGGSQMANPASIISSGMSTVAQNIQNYQQALNAMIYKEDIQNYIDTVLSKPTVRNTGQGAINYALMDANRQATLTQAKNKLKQAPTKTVSASITSNDTGGTSNMLTGADLFNTVNSFSPSGNVLEDIKNAGYNVVSSAIGAGETKAISTISQASNTPTASNSQPTNTTKLIMVFGLGIFAVLAMKMMLAKARG